MDAQRPSRPPVPAVAQKGQRIGRWNRTITESPYQIWVSCDVLEIVHNLNLFGFQAIPVIVFPPLDFKAMCRCAMPAPADRAVEAITDSSAKLTAFVMSFAPRQGVNGAKWRKMVKSSRCHDPDSDSNLMRALQPDLLNVACQSLKDLKVDTRSTKQHIARPHFQKNCGKDAKTVIPLYPIDLLH